MRLVTSQNISQTFPDIDELISDAQNAEICRDLVKIESLLSLIWSNLESEPNFAGYGTFEQAQLFRISGHFLSNLGRSKNLKNYQERGKNLLTQSIQLFDELGYKDQKTEAEIQLSYSYYLEGRIEEFNIFLDLAESRYRFDKSNSIFLLIQVEKLIVLLDTHKFNEADQLINSLNPLILKSNDLKIITQFHTQAGIIYRRTKNFEKSLFHFELGISSAKALGHQRYLANLQNSLGNLYRSWGKFELAHLKVDEALDMSKTLGDVGWEAHYLDTKANIYFDQGDYDNALDLINKSILFFLQGEDYSGRAEAFWLKTQIYLKIDLRELALELFYKIIQLAFIYLNEKSVQAYLEKFCQLAYFPSGESYKEQISNFKRYLIETALIKSDGIASEAASELKLLPGTLSEILRKQFPKLQKDLDMKKDRLSRKKVKSSKAITPYVLNKNNIEFPVSFSEKLYFFHLHKEKAQKIFGFSNEILIAVMPVDSISEGDLFLFRSNELRVGKIRFQGEWEILDFESDLNINISEIKLLGKLIGYTPTKFTNAAKVVFYDFNNILQK